MVDNTIFLHNGTRWNRAILRFVSVIIGFTIGYIGYVSIHYAWAECLPSKTAHLELDSVSTDDDIATTTVNEKDRWPTDAFICGHMFYEHGASYSIRFSKDAK